MDQLLILLGGAVVALVLGYLFIKHYKAIDCRIFGKTKRVLPALKDGASFGTRVIVETDADYQSFGLAQVLVSALVGTVFPMAPFIRAVTKGRSDADDVFILLAMLTLTIIFSFNLYEAIARMPNAEKRVGKFLFLTLSCAIGVGVGALGAALIIAAVVFYIIFLAFRMMLHRDTYTLTDESGGKRRLKENPDGGLTDDKGNRWRHNNDSTASRDD